MRLKFLLALLFIINTLFALTQEQIKTLQIIRDVAKAIPNKRGETFEDTLSAICLTESAAGTEIFGDFNEDAPITKASFGIMQIQVATARFMASTYSELSFINNMSELKLANKLLGDVKFSATIAAYYMKWLSDYRKTYYNAVSGYNGGLVNPNYCEKVDKNKTVVYNLVRTGVLK